jgi:hypothetical protein
MLALDSSIGCIEASEADVLDLYSSTPVMMALRNGSRQEQCEAYVCSIRKKRGVQVYLALVANNRKIFVYTSTGAPETEKEYHHTLEEALEFARSLGFVPRAENLNYSPAMREVVVRNFKILRAPGSRVQALLRNGTADAAPPVPAPKRGPEKVATPSPSVVSAPPATPRSTTPAKPGAVQPAAPDAAVTPMDGAAVAGATVVATALASAAAWAQPVASAVATAAAGPALATLPSPAGTPLSGQTETGLTRALEQSQAREQTARNLAAQLQGRLEQLEQSLAERDEHSARHDALQCEWEQNRRLLEASLTELKGVLAQREAALAESNAQSAAQLQQETAARKALDAELGPLRQRLQALTVELEASRQELSVIRIQKEELAEQLASLAGELTAAREARAGLLAGHDALVEQLAAVRAEAPDLAALQAALASLEAESASAGQLRHEALGLKKDLAAARAAHQEELAQALASVATLESEVAAAGEQAGRLAAKMELSESLAQAARQELEAACLDRDQSRATLRALQNEHARVMAELASVQEELAAAAGESLALQKVATPRDPASIDQEVPKERQLAADDDFPSVHQPNSSGAHRNIPAAAELATVGDTGSFVWTDDLSSLDQTAPTHTPTARTTSVAADWYQQPDGPSGASLGFSSTEDDFFPSDDGAAGGPGSFTLCPELAAIACTAPEQLVQLHTSSNVAYLSPDGKGPDSCQGYICCLRDGPGFRIFIGLFAPKSSRTWVYAPQFQPEDSDARARATAAAMEFAEGVGLMMEEIQVGTGCRELVARCPVLHCDQDR